jgi:hypothetical protein
VVATLQEQRYVVRDSEYRVTVADPARLLKRWAAFHDFLSQNKFETFQVFAEDADDLVARARLIDVSYAITGLAGAWLAAPHVRPATLDVYVTLNASKVTPATSIGQNAPGVRCKPASKTVNQAEHKLTGVKNQLESLGS